MKQPLSEISHTHRDFFGFVTLPSYERTPSLYLQEVYTLRVQDRAKQAAHSGSPFSISFSEE
jgi:hypothetical protein